MKCEKCKQVMNPGLDGVAFGKTGIHDSCAGIVRDAYGYIWTPADLERGYIVLTDPGTGEKTKWLYTPRPEGSPA